LKAYDQNTMPLVYGLHAAVLVQHSSDDYKKNVIKPRIDNHLVFNETFRINDLPGGYGHRDGLRGIVKTEAHLRSGCWCGNCNEIIRHLHKHTHL
jgi:hypothetical protein